jgi:hypothetical protein
MLKPTALYGNALISLPHSVTTDIQTLKNIINCFGIVEQYCECVENCHTMADLPRMDGYRSDIMFDDKPGNPPIL